MSASSNSPSVLYDAPGPRARVRNAVMAIVFGALLVVLIGWVVMLLDDAGHLTAAKWSPFVTDSRVWTTYLLPGLMTTLTAAFFAIVIALPLGAILGVARLSDHGWIRRPAGAIVEFFRAIPVLILMLFANEAYAMFTDVARENRPLYAVVTGLVLYNASVLAEVVRAGILSLPRGQSDAARAIGMRKNQTMRFVLLPQAVTAMLPALVSQLVVIVKDTALGGAMLGLNDLLRQTTLISANYGANIIASMTVVALIYIVLNFLLTSFASWLEGRIRRGKRGSGAVVATDPGELLELETPPKQAPDIRTSGTAGPIDPSGPALSGESGDRP
ncbi:amino acid ABC transporter permease [Streptomyces calidiresistens]|uniref:ABC transporter permease subunit n=1 Tax=Streptomyces calidiresistens TaxID=1485586 RepID=A0A7W3T0Z3_9ACTN|nr:amino acid ABC transporter permease [Streptomyces calidiresistens]MBB0228912.1 ABC transporter permease subunit [Streptomyces calidiresistens]